MASILGKKITKQDLLKYSGNFAHLAGICRSRFTEGKAKGADLLTFRTGSGLEFTVALDKCMDLLTLSYRGVVLSQMMKNGPTANFSGLPIKGYFPKSVNGGMMYTCGLLNVGSDCTDTDGNYYPFHGQIGFTPADNIGMESYWEGDDYILKATGTMRESALFGDNLTLSRQLTTAMGSNELEIKDVVENLSPMETRFNILYHVNYGFPFLNANAKLTFPQGDINPLSEDSEAGLDECDNISSPIDGIKDQVFQRKLESDKEGYCTVRVENQEFGIGSYLSYQAENLPNFLHWKSMVSGDYALGFLPTNSSCAGRLQDIENGTICTLKPCEKIEFKLKIGVYDL